MKMNEIHKILGSLLVWMLISCNTDERLLEEEGGTIALCFSTGLSVSRTADTEIESALSHFDVFVWKLDGDNDTPQTRVHYERIMGPLESPVGTAALSVQKDFFTKDELYRVDVVANATANKNEMDKLDEWEELWAARQSDERIQITGGHQLGTVGTTILNVPTHFLMDGILVGAAGNKTKLNDGTKENVQLNVNLNRAAAKVEVRLKHGNTIRFDDSAEAKAAMGYYLRNMRYNTSLLADGENPTPQLRRTNLFADALNVFFKWEPQQVTITTYVYSHQWEQSEFFEKGTRMAVNLPVWSKAEAITENEIPSEENGWTKYPNNYYQVLLTKSNSFKRNTHYIVEATIDMPGATDNSEPIPLRDLKYSVLPWNTIQVDVGADHRPSYLSVNKDTLDMHNIPKDSTSLYFISSSAVKVTVQEAYYYDKFGQKTTVSITGNRITAIPDSGLQGNIEMFSPIPENNAIRYIKLKVENNDNSAPEYVLVRQYPLEYITNIQAWYSYRSDFSGTTYEKEGNNGYVNASWSNNKWNYGRNSGTSDGATFGSKVASVKTNGTSTLYYYYWRNNRGNRYGYARTSTGNLSALNNARMYHVRITSTSNEYKVGIPKQTIKDGGHYTDDSAINNELVSPSFMIASQLGASQAVTNKDFAASHCANYVETYKDGNTVVHLSNWRLPTQEEIQIITKFQYVPNAAMDEVLSGDHYWSAAGIVQKSSGELTTSVSQANIRCVRDAY